MDYSDGRTYRVVFVKKALQDIRNLDKRSYIQVRDVVNSLAYNARPPQASKTGRSKWKMVVPAGNYDIYYEIDSVALFIIVAKLESTT